MSTKDEPGLGRNLLSTRSQARRLAVIDIATRITPPQAGGNTQAVVDTAARLDAFIERGETEKPEKNEQ